MQSEIKLQDTFFIDIIIIYSVKKCFATIAYFDVYSMTTNEH